jgi:hypothetical protein
VQGQQIAGLWSTKHTYFNIGYKYMDDTTGIRHIARNRRSDNLNVLVRQLQDLGGTRL